MRIHPILIFTAVVGAVCVCQAPARAGVPADVPDNGSVPLVVKPLPEEFRRTNEVDREDFYGMYPPGPARPYDQRVGVLR